MCNTFLFMNPQPLTVLDLESSEERGGTSLSNPAEAQLALHLFNSLKNETGGLSTKSRVAVVSDIFLGFHFISAYIASC
jgi:hypothetical protein